MSSQLFRKTVPIDILLSFLKEYSTVDGNFHVFSKTSFKKAVYHNKIAPFCESIVEYYHKSKRYYVERQIDYCKFTTILRQLCKLHSFPYISRIVYSKSTYDILYYISLPSIPNAPSTPNTPNASN